MLLEQPNPDDPLMTDIAEIYSTDQAKFQKTAKEYTKQVCCATFLAERLLCVLLFLRLAVLLNMIKQKHQDANLPPLFW